MDETLRLDAYLRRIGFAGEPKADLATLTALHANHVGAIPFEALDPFLRRPVGLDLATLQRKLVEGRRGGYCFELNTLFKAGLEAIGFSVTALGARVRWMSAPQEPLGPRSHMLLMVETPQGPHLADVGFGSCLIDAPLPLVVDRELATPMGVYRLAETDGRFALSARRGDIWRTMYVFDLEPQLPADFAMANWFASTHPAPPFQRFVMVENVARGERRKIVNRRYVVEARNGVVASEREFANGEEMGRALDEVFGITSPVPAAELFAATPPP